MKQTIQLMQAPAQMSPGNYIAKAYVDITDPFVKSVEVDTIKSKQSWEIKMRWACPEPVTSLKESTDRFIDAAAILVPSHKDSQWVTMGSPQAPVEGALWRADKSKPFKISSQGLGTVERQTAPANWRVQSKYKDGHYQLHWLFPNWQNLVQFGQCGFAIWTGSQQQRAGIKSVSQQWVELT